MVRGLLQGLLSREDSRDAFISRVAPSLEALPAGATVGTSSPRRQALNFWVTRRSRSYQWPHLAPKKKLLRQAKPPKPRAMSK